MLERTFYPLARQSPKNISACAEPGYPLSHCTSIRGKTRRHLLTSLTLVVLLGCGFVLSGCSSEFHDEEYSKLFEVLNERWIPDNNIPSVSMGFDTDVSSGSDKETWLAIELSFTKNCSETADDPCEALADEMARIVFEQYARVDDLDGFRVIITNESAYGPVLAGSPNAHLGIITGSTLYRSPDHLVKSLTIREWREELFINDLG